MESCWHRWRCLTLKRPAQRQTQFGWANRRRCEYVGRSTIGLSLNECRANGVKKMIIIRTTARWPALRAEIAQGKLAHDEREIEVTPQDAGSPECLARVGIATAEACNA